MTNTALTLALAQINAENSKDPNVEVHNEIAYPKELLYADRMHQRLLSFSPSASEALVIAAHAQHICRWKMPRETYPINRVGYLQWRQELKKFHANVTAEILVKLGFDEAFIQRVSFLIEKKELKKDAETQVLEDVICLVFLEFYLAPFVLKHDSDKLKNIFLKTWNKMSERGHAEALKLEYAPSIFALIKEALGL